MATEAAGEAAEKDLLTLTDVAKKAGISMPTAAKYKKRYQGRIPTVGEGRSQKYPPAAVGVFQEIYQENLSKRGRGASADEGPKKAPRKRKAKAKVKVKGSKARPKAGTKPAKAKSAKTSRTKTSRTKTRRAKTKRAKAASSASAGLMPLTNLAKRAGISYPTAQSYVKKHLDRIPNEGKGRTRRYPEEAVAAVRAIYEENLSKRGGGGRGKTKKTAKRAAAKKSAPATKRAAAGGAGGARLASVLNKLEKRIASLEKLMSKPLKVEIKR
jgi:hypothetical protein